MQIKFQESDNYSNSKIQPPNFFGCSSEKEKKKLIEYLEDVIQALENGDVQAFEVREGVDVVGFNII